MSTIYFLFFCGLFIKLLSIVVLILFDIKAEGTPPELCGSETDRFDQFVGEEYKSFEKMLVYVHIIFRSVFFLTYLD